MLVPPRIIYFSDRDDEIAADLREIEPDQTYGLRNFPAPDRYHDRVRDLINGTDTTDRRICQIYALAQRDWHIRGQTGCMFARLAAIDADSLRWAYIVATYTGVECAAVEQICEAIRLLTEMQDVQTVSILLPKVRTPAHAVAVIRALGTTGSFWLQRDEESDGYLHLHLRYKLRSPNRVDAWVMAFAPFAFVPNTRRGPYFELAIRAKEKEQWLFHRLNQDRAIAHLADVPLQMSDERWEHRWTSTIRRTRMILDGEPNQISAAKSTLAVPARHFADQT